MLLVDRIQNLLFESAGLLVRREIFILSYGLGRRRYSPRQNADDRTYLLEVLQHLGVLSCLLDELREGHIEIIPFQFLILLTSVDFHSTLLDALDNGFELFQKVFLADRRDNRSRSSEERPPCR